MPGYETVPSPSYPAPNYTDFATILGNLANTYRQGANAQMDLDQRTAFKNGVPMTPDGLPDVTKIMQTEAGAGDPGAIERFFPILQGQRFRDEARQGASLLDQLSPLQTPQKPTGDLPPASAAGSNFGPTSSGGDVSVTDAPNITNSGALIGVPRQGANQGPFGNLTGISTAGDSVYGIAEQVISDPAKRAKASDFVERLIGAEPGQKLTPEQSARAQRILENMARSGGARVPSWSDVQRDNAEGTANLPRVAAEGQAAAGGADPNAGNVIGQIKSGIAKVESGGSYGAIGPVTPSGDRAYGKYQVMGENVGPWTKEVLGYAMTPQEFLRDQGAQEAVASGKIQELLAKGNSPQDVASMWLTGKPLAQGANLRDQNGTSGAQYAREVTSQIGPQTGAASAQDTGSPLTPQFRLPPGMSPQQAIVRIDSDIAKLSGNPDADLTVKALEHMRGLLYDQMKPVEATPGRTFVDPVTKQTLYQAPYPGGGMSPAAIDNAAAVWIKTGDMPKNIGRGQQGAQDIIAIQNRAAEMMQEQGITQDALAAMRQQYKGQQATIKEFDVGSAGKSVGSFNTLVSHLETLRNAVAALKNGDIRLFNTARQEWNLQTGGTAPTNFDGVRELVGDELVKAITGGAGALGDREAIKKTISSSNSPQELYSLLDQYRELAVGQLKTLRRRYEAGTGLKDFDKFLDPETRQFFGDGGAGSAGSQGPSAATGGSAKGLPPGTYTYDPNTGQLVPSK